MRRHGTDMPMLGDGREATLAHNNGSMNKVTNDKCMLVSHAQLSHPALRNKNERLATHDYDSDIKLNHLFACAGPQACQIYSHLIRDLLLLARSDIGLSGGRRLKAKQQKQQQRRQQRANNELQPPPSVSKQIT
jgi:hypothetical protein